MSCGDRKRSQDWYMHCCCDLDMAVACPKTRGPVGSREGDMLGALALPVPVGHGWERPDSPLPLGAAKTYQMSVG